jgi:adhesin transport system membrane fusion protein
MARDIRGGNPLRSSLLLFAILALIGAVTAWAAIAELDAVTRAEGRVVPSADIQVVQPFEPGVISEIHVVEGDTVAAGDPLISLDTQQIDSELSQARRRVQTLELRISRLKAEIADEAFVPAPEIAAVSPGLVASEMALFAARATALEDELRVLRQQARQREEELREAAVRVSTSREALALTDEEIDVIRPLVESEIEPRTTLIGLLGRRAEAAGRLASAKAAVSAGEAAMDEVGDRIEAVRSRSNADALDELAFAEAELSETRVALPALVARRDRAVLSAPTKGVVNRVLIGTIGGVARAGDALVEIVPIEDELLIEAYLPPADVAFVRSDQPVRVSITAYDSSRYGAIDGAIIRVGADAVQRPGRDDSVFVVEIRTTGGLTDAVGEPLEIVPGMVASVDILSGSRSILEYLIAPVIRVKETAFRE